MLLWINGRSAAGRRLTIAQAADRVGASAGLTLTPDTQNALRARASQARVTIKHIRIG
ncbi:MAG TPA: hypothetical protein VNW50_18365 [Streptosporangiaceae bacterium]|nr:hypothetical protein [Streptosporangiaceae bacterium]